VGITWFDIIFTPSSLDATTIAFWTCAITLGYVSQSTFSTYDNGDPTLIFLVLHVLQAAGTSDLRRVRVGNIWIVTSPAWDVLGFGTSLGKFADRKLNILSHEHELKSSKVLVEKKLKVASGGALRVRLARFMCVAILSRVWS